MDRARRVHRRWRNLMAILVAAPLAVSGVLVAGGTVAAGPAFAGDTSADRIFASLDEAVDAGAIDSATVSTLRKKRTVDAFAIFDAADVVAAYGGGDKKSVAQAASLLKTMRDGVFGRVDVTVLKTYTLVPAALVRLSSEDMALKLLNDVAVRSIAINYLNHLYAQHNLELIHQPSLGAGGADGRGTTVVVLDTGADITQPEFGGCTAPGVPASCHVPVMVEAAPSDGVMDDDGHGTNTAAIAATVAPGAQIVPIDVFSKNVLGAWDVDGLAGLDWVLTNRVSRNIRSVNLSFGNKQFNTSPCTGNLWDRNAYQWPFQMLRGAGVLPVVAAGNDAVANGVFSDGLAYPACTPGAVAVGAMYSAPIAGNGNFGSCTDVGPIPVETIPCFSQDGSLLDILAPGIQIFDGGQLMSGTSQAAPHVAGAAAVLAQVSPLSTSDVLKSFLLTSHAQVTDPRSGRTHPRLDLNDAVRAAAPVPNDNQAAATVLSGWGGRIAQTTWTATKEPGEPDHGANPGGASVWYRWTPSQTATATFTTDGSDFDTLLSVYRANGSALTLLSEDDNTGPANTSAVTVPVTAGDAILIAVDGARPIGATFAATGHAKLAWNLSNDALAQAQSLPALAPGTTLNVSGANVGATHQAGEPHHCDDLFATASVWYSYTPASNQSLRVRAAGTQLLCVAIYSTTSTTTQPTTSQLAAETYATDDNGTPIDITLAASATRSYWIAVDGVSMDQGCNANGQCFYTTPTGTFGLTLN
jgi:subtilisin family serine protease